MENIIEKRVAPLLKCLFLLIFVFTAKVLTTNPIDESDSKHDVHHSKPPYVRTFIKYHHRRTTDWNAIDEWPYVHDRVEKKVQKRDVLYQSTDYTPNSVKESSKFRKNNFKASDSTTLSSRISCLYKIHSVSLSVTPSYEDDQNIQQVVENDHFEAPGPLSETTLPNGETVQVEQCTDSRASCYTLLQQDPDGNVTVLGQGCWRSSQNSGAYSCDLCTTVTPKLPDTKFCCCTKNYCNADFMSLKDYVATPKAGLTQGGEDQGIHYSQIVAAGIVGVSAIMVLGFVISTFYCKKLSRDISDGAPLDHVESLGDTQTLATGLSCVDNLTLIEHIGQGKFGSVWRGRLGSIPVAVKLYANGSTWQKEAAIYSMPYLSHSNILKYYGSDSRPSLTDGGSRHLIVVELCRSTLRSRLIEKPLTWMEFAELAHGISAALASLHNQGPNKPCIVHRDVNSNNVLISWDGVPKLADLGLAQVVQSRSTQPAPRRITEAGTLRYLAPEALEGALDLSGARAALCAVDVYALGLVLWEMLWRTSGAHATSTPPYSPPYQLVGLEAPTLPQLQNLVSRNKMRPPLPRGPVFDNRALRIAADTCDECWDHDAEARLTAVCVEERMSELKQMLSTPVPVIEDKNLHRNSDSTTGQSLDAEKSSNSSTLPPCDLHTPLLYTQIPKNTHTSTNPVDIIQKSIKEFKERKKKVEKLKNVSDTCFSVARMSPPNVHSDNNCTDEAKSQKSTTFGANDINAIEMERKPNLTQDIKIEKPLWGLKRFFERKLNRVNKPLETEVTLNSELVKTSVVDEKNVNYRPNNLILNPDDRFFEGPCTLSPPNRTLSPTMMIESELNNDKVFGFKETPKDETHNQIFAVIVPKLNTDFRDGVIELHHINDSDKDIKNSHPNIINGNSISDDSTLKQRISESRPSKPNSASSSRASINLELQYIQNGYELTDCSSSEDEQLLLLSENDGQKITMQSLSKFDENVKNDVLKETTLKEVLNAPKYRNFENESSDPNDKENAFTGDNPLYLAAINGEMLFKVDEESTPKRSLKNLIIRQHSLEQVSEIFTSSGDIHLQNPAGRVKTPGDLPIAIRKARRDKLQRGRMNDCNRLSLYDDRMMFGNSL